MKYSYLYALCLLICSVSMVNARTMKNEYDANHSSVRYIGRTLVEDGSVSFDWVGIYFEMRMSGGKLSLRVTDKGTSFYNVFVDGHLHNVVKVCGTDTVINFISDISRDFHSVRVQKRTEGEFGKTTIHKFILSSSGRLKAEPKKKTRHIEFIGNSLTCGYGAEGRNYDEPFKLETENCYWSFSNIISRYFDADYTLIAHSGRGIVRNYGDSVRVSAVTMTDKMLQTFDENPDIKWNFKSYLPDLVVINLGTNDFSLEPHPYKSEFVKAYIRMIHNIRTHYGNVPVLCIYANTITAPVLSYYEEAIRQINDKKVYLFQLKQDLMNDSTDWGACWHPNYIGHKKIAMSLIPYISTIMNWNMAKAVIE